MIGDKHSTKLIDAKIRFAQEQRFMATEKIPDDSGRLPPGQSKVKGLPVLDLGIHPEISRAEWQLVIDGFVNYPCTIGWEQFAGLEQTQILADIHCVTSWSSYDNKWAGVKLEVLIQLVCPKEGATHVMLHGYDGYSTNVPIDELLREDCLVATSWNDEVLSTSHGGPARLVIPNLYFWKSAKWIKRIEFLTDDAPGYWEQRGYHNDGDPWQEQRYGKLIKLTAPAEVQEITPSAHNASSSPSLLSRLRAWVNYHFFPD